MSPARSACALPIVVAWAFACACSDVPAPQCKADSQCPPGFVCASGKCGEAPREDAGGSPSPDAAWDAGPAADAAGPADAALTPDAASGLDASAGADAAVPPDAAVLPDAGPADAGAAPDAGPASADAGTSPEPAFVVGINLAGPAVTIAGNPWLAYADALATQVVAVQDAQTYVSAGYPFAFAPPPDAQTSVMLQSQIWRWKPADGQGFSLAFPIANGSYRVQLWTLEDYRDGYRDIDVRIEGVVVASGLLGNAVVGQWVEHQSDVAVTDGRLDVEVLRATKGFPQLAGIAIERL